MTEEELPPIEEFCKELNTLVHRRNDVKLKDENKRLQEEVLQLKKKISEITPKLREDDYNYCPFCGKKMGNDNYDDWDY